MKAVEALKIIVYQLEGEISDHGHLYPKDELADLVQALQWAKSQLKEDES